MEWITQSVCIPFCIFVSYTKKSVSRADMKENLDETMLDILFSELVFVVIKANQ